jgi:hypothetical protein
MFQLGIGSSVRVTHRFPCYNIVRDKELVHTESASAMGIEE